LTRHRGPRILVSQAEWKGERVTKHNVPEIAEQFEFEGGFVKAAPHGSGHINDTYAVSCDRSGAVVRYVLQRINHEVFKNPPAVMDNILRVTSHLRAKLEQERATDVARRVLTVIPTRAGANYHQDADGNFWRAYGLIENARTYDVAQSPEQAFTAAKAFGDFQRMLADMPPPPLHDSIPNFHNGPMRYAQFEKALREDVVNRARNAKPEIEFLLAQGWIFDVLPKLVESGEIPVRITHNDTKINNVMFDDATGEGLCVIDLDTVMPGLAHYDFGDLVRTSTCLAAEDERDLSKVRMEMPLFESVARGYLVAAGRFLNKAERDHLVLGGKMITLIMGTRFLTDHLAGDVYYKIHREGHNLDRCRVQFELVRSIVSHEEEMNALVERIGSR
jgi:aminoglycoside phosphotransferase (APT) family kinase protein